ncbi:MAG TPA: Rieske 2Fe-2S domain-containing protein [Candidatus Binatia bacterium]|nr:Rieske 2Fe-2S domain-containing protein [Candidatus Binatia bacterium]
MASAKRKNNRRRKRLRYQDLVSTRPDSLAGKFMRRFWHPIYRAEELGAGQAKPVEIMSERFTLYRGESGMPHVVDFRCPHRGTQLSAGWVEGDSIRCMYHGWRFDSTGQCTEQPAEEKSFAAKIRIKSYPTREYLGLIFTYLGEDAAPPFPLYRHMEEDGVLEVLSTEVWPCNFFQRIDNNGDTYHVPFVHRGAYSASSVNNRSGLPKISKEESPWGTTGYASFAQGWRNVFQFFMPNVYAFRNPSPEPECAWEDRMQWDVPLDDEHSLEFRLRRLPVVGNAARDYCARRAASATEPTVSVAQMGDAVLSGKLGFQELDNFFKDKISLVHTQDYVAQVGQGRLASRDHEHLGRSDVGVILFRKIWERELRALAEARPLKKWVLPQDVGIKFQEEPEKLLQNA